MTSKGAGWQLAKGVVKSFRGRIIGGEVKQINLHRVTGSMGYRIIKFDLLPVLGDAAYETTVQIFSTPQTTASATIDFSNQELLGAAWYAFEGSGSAMATGYMKQVFDNVIFNQDIFVTCFVSQTVDINYYIELEQMNLDIGEQTVATLKDVRNNQA